MKFNVFKTREGRLRNKLLSFVKEKDIDAVVVIIKEYEQDNIDTIEKLKKGKTLDINKINGAIKQTINVHGPITKQLIGSASKRIYGALLTNKTESFFEKLKRLFNKKAK